MCPLSNIKIKILIIQFFAIKNHAQSRQTSRACRLKKKKKKKTSNPPLKSAASGSIYLGKPVKRLLPGLLASLGDPWVIYMHFFDVSSCSFWDGGRCVTEVWQSLYHFIIEENEETLYKGGGRDFFYEVHSALQT